jgi:hypothetical protein
VQAGFFFGARLRVRAAPVWIALVGTHIIELQTDFSGFRTAGSAESV